MVRFTHPTETLGEATMEQHRGALAALIFSLVAVQGLTINLMPVLFGTIARTFEVNLRQQGQLQSVFLAGGMIALLVSGYVTESIGAKRSGMAGRGIDRHRLAVVRPGGKLLRGAGRGLRDRRGKLLDPGGL